jgi:hypothetical protein
MFKSVNVSMKNVTRLVTYCEHAIKHTWRSCEKVAKYNIKGKHFAETYHQACDNNVNLLYKTHMKIVWTY